MTDSTRLDCSDTVDERDTGTESADVEVERYRVDALLGRGGMGIVTAYYDRRIGRSIACKELRRDADDSAGARVRFLREARVQGQLEHPAIVPVYDIGTRADGSPYFTMKTIRGTTLADVIAKLVSGDPDKRYALHRLLAAFSRVCLAVEYAHERGVLHRDLKPANLILGEYGEVYVLDWGLAKIVAEPEPAPTADARAIVPVVTDASAFLGTPGYMAPEQIDDPRSVGPTADVYSLCAILFELLTLEPLHPRGLEALQSTRSGVEARPSVRAPDCNAPVELEAAIVRGTALDPAGRPTPRELSEVIERYLEGERNVELRRASAAIHAQSAAEAVADARGAEPAALAARQRALQEINRALVLDPANSGAMDAMVQLMTQPLEATPPEVVEHAERKFRRDLRWISGVAAGIYVSMIGFVAVMWAMGIREAAPIVVFFASMIVTGALSVVVARSAAPSTLLVNVAIMTSACGFAFATRFMSPLMLVPTAVVVNAMGYAVFLRRLQRTLILLASCASFLVPLALELAGVIEPTFAFEHGRLVILPMALDLPAAPTIAAVVMASVLGVVLAAMIMGHICDRLAAAELRLFVYNWHLRVMMPHEVRAKVEPMRPTVQHIVHRAP